LELVTPLLIFIFHQIPQVRIHRADIPPEISNKSVARINEAMDKYQIEKDMATYVKKKMDEEFGGTWHCVVGRNFGCSITHDTKYVLFFQIDQMHVLLFKSHE
jgi:dynein light chain LC8-type